MNEINSSKRLKFAVAEHAEGDNGDGIRRKEAAAVSDNGGMDDTIAIPPLPLRPFRFRFFSQQTCNPLHQINIPRRQARCPCRVHRLALGGSPP